MSEIRILPWNSHGLKRYTEHLQAMEVSGSFIPVEHLLSDPELTIEIPGNPTIEIRPLASKEDAAEHIYNSLSGCEEALRRVGVNPLGHEGLMTWLDAAFVEQTLTNSKGKFHVGELSRHVYNFKPRVVYRHLLGGPYEIYARLATRPDLRAMILSSPLTANSENYEQIASRKHIVGDVAALELIRRLYRDTAIGRELPGASAKGSKSVPGGLRRLGTVYNQLEVRIDLRGMASEDVEKLLPGEFQTWLSGTPPTPVRRRRAKSAKRKRR